MSLPSGNFRGILPLELFKPGTAISARVTIADSSRGDLCRAIPPPPDNNSSCSAYFLDSDWTFPGFPADGSPGWCPFGASHSKQFGESNFNFIRRRTFLQNNRLQNQVKQKIKETIEQCGMHPESQFVSTVKRLKQGGSKVCKRSPTVDLLGCMRLKT
jgi:hypothetical protein